MLHKPRLSLSSTGIIRDVPARILQFGGGNFLRGFVDRMLDDLNRETDFKGGVVVVKPTEAGDYSALRLQDGLFHVWISGKEKGGYINRQQLVTNIIDVIHPYRQWSIFLDTAGNPNIDIVISNTTEAGIRFVDEAFDITSCPMEFPAKFLHWLWRRYHVFEGDLSKGCLILPCELIPDNGGQLLTCLEQLSDLWDLDRDFVQWMRKANDFCNTLVDQIIPGKPNDPSDSRFETMQFEDDLITTAEPYHIWVIDGPDHVKRILPFEKTDLNVVFSDDIGMYRNRKIRILNGAHTAMVPVGFLYGIDTVREVVDDPVAGAYVRSLIFDEIIPSMDLDERMLNEYGHEVLDRFTNPSIRHELLTISLNSVVKFGMRLLPTITDYNEKFNRLPRLTVFALSALIVFYQGNRGEHTITLKDDDTVIQLFQKFWCLQSNGTLTLAEFVSQLLSHTVLWGKDLRHIAGLPNLVKDHIEEIQSRGMPEALLRLLNESRSLPKSD